MIYPIILCGGEGKRFGGDIPKQFQSVISNKPMVIETALRYRDPIFYNPIFVTNDKHHDLLSDMVDDNGLNALAILTEDEPKNTAPAIALALRYIQDNDPLATIFICPSDHDMPDTLPLINAIKSFNLDSSIACFGARPTYPSTEYGYIKLGEERDNDYYDIDQFIEKPNERLAEKLCRNDKIYWNMGLFLGRNKIFIDAYKKHASALWKGNDQSSISFDYAIMEKIDNAVGCPLEIHWKDIGVSHSD
jgi:mannose-1-phosphate guanylyltransferase/mannose-6-phosphate isomerase